MLPTNSFLKKNLKKNLKKLLKREGVFLFCEGEKIFCEGILIVQSLIWIRLNLFNVFQGKKFYV